MTRIAEMIGAPTAYDGKSAKSSQNGMPSKINAEEVNAVATKILHLVFQYRRAVESDLICDELKCTKCLEPHLQKVANAISRNQEISFVLPAFPGKSPNPSKVLGPLPDMAERLALQFLNRVCAEIQELYAPGAHVILCSDGRVFSDVIGMVEQDVTDYQDELSRMIDDQKLSHLSTFNLDELANGMPFSLVRDSLMKHYGAPLDILKAKIRRAANGSTNHDDIEAHRMYCGITRFLFEDSLRPGPSKSKTALQKNCRERASLVIQRSNAWSQFISERFPDSVRLSIHPQACGSSKLGIQLLGIEQWMTPWHGVAVDCGSDFVLMKRRDAEERGGSLVFNSSGRPSHYAMNPSKSRLEKP
jgi:L-tyrosine isonitrile synthase